VDEEKVDCTRTDFGPAPLVIEIVSLTPLAPLALVVHTRDAGFHLGFATPAVRQA